MYILSTYFSITGVELWLTTSSLIFANIEISQKALHSLSQIKILLMFMFRELFSEVLGWGIVIIGIIYMRTIVLIKVSPIVRTDLHKALVYLGQESLTSWIKAMVFEFDDVVTLISISELGSVYLNSVETSWNNWGVLNKNKTRDPKT